MYKIIIFDYKPNRPVLIQQACNSVKLNKVLVKHHQTIAENINDIDDEVILIFIHYGNPNAIDIIDEIYNKNYEAIKNISHNNNVPIVVYTGGNESMPSEYSQNEYFIYLKGIDTSTTYDFTLFFNKWSDFNSPPPLELLFEKYINHIFCLYLMCQVYLLHNKISTLGYSELPKNISTILPANQNISKLWDILAEIDLEKGLKKEWLDSDYESSYSARFIKKISEKPYAILTQDVEDVYKEIKNILK